MAEWQTGKKLKAVRVDGGGEFVNNEWREWAKKHRIKLEVIPAYSSSANGVAERKHGTTFARVRAILNDSGLLKFLWVHTAAYIVH
jgi:transposase InsO family protein